MVNKQYECNNKSEQQSGGNNKKVQAGVICVCITCIKGMPNLRHAITKYQLLEGNIGIDFEIIIKYRKNRRLAYVPLVAKEVGGTKPDIFSSGH